MALPAGVVVSSPCWRRNRSILSACSSDRKPTKSCRLRPNRSTDHAMTMSNSRRAASRHSLSNAGRLSRPFGAADAVVPVDLDDLAAHATSDLAQLALLVGRGLFDGADAEVDNRLAHGLASRFETPTGFVAITKLIFER